MNWTFARLFAILFCLIVITGVSFTLGVPYLGWSFFASSIILFFAISLGYLNGDIKVQDGS